MEKTGRTGAKLLTLGVLLMGVLGSSGGAWACGTCPYPWQAGPAPTGELVYEQSESCQLIAGASITFYLKNLGDLDTCPADPPFTREDGLAAPQWTITRTGNPDHIQVIPSGTSCTVTVRCDATPEDSVSVSVVVPDNAGLADDNDLNLGGFSVSIVAQ